MLAINGRKSDPRLNTTEAGRRSSPIRSTIHNSQIVVLQGSYEAFIHRVGEITQRQSGLPVLTWKFEGEVVDVFWPYVVVIAGRFVAEVGEVNLVTPSPNSDNSRLVHKGDVPHIFHRSALNYVERNDH